jgi:hypothetical protein
MNGIGKRRLSPVGGAGGRAKTEIAEIHRQIVLNTIKKCPLLGHFFRFSHGHKRFRGERQLDEPVQVVIKILAANVALELIDLFHNQLDVMETLKCYFCTNL